jgi:penicillin-binding protein 1A
MAEVMDMTELRGILINLPILLQVKTTQNQSDGWFMGMVPNLVTGVWVGNEDRSALSKYYLRGATAALPVWAYFETLLC